jgi:hypothetical protein
MKIQLNKEEIINAVVEYLQTYQERKVSRETAIFIIDEMDVKEDEPLTLYFDLEK